jgi:hypothetical protein
MGPKFKDQAVEDGTEKSSGNIHKYLPIYGEEHPRRKNIFRFIIPVVFYANDGG